MRKFLVSTLMCVWLLSPSNTFAKQANLLEKVEAASESQQSWQADFEQITTVEALGENLHKTGTIAAAKPKQFNITYTSEPQKTYIYNGKKLWLHQVQSQSVINFKNPENLISSEALSFLSGLEKLSALFREAENADIPSFQFQNKKLTPLKLSPLQDNGSIQFLVLGLDSKLNTEEAFLLTPSGNSTHYIFKNHVKNPTLDKSLFTWTKQQGIKEIQQ